jgi:hypothetical protein
MFQQIFLFCYTGHGGRDIEAGMMECWNMESGEMIVLPIIPNSTIPFLLYRPVQKGFQGVVCSPGPCKYRGELSASSFTLFLNCQKSSEPYAPPPGRNRRHWPEEQSRTGVSKPANHRR